MNTEADTCRKFIVPKLQIAGWDDAPCAINEQRSFTDGRVMFVGGAARRGKRKRADYLTTHQKSLALRNRDVIRGIRFDWAEDFGWAGLKRWRRRSRP
ncbi:MAG: hypothetical protein H0X27_05500, partial [Caulobacteraceae bacterium]|nr:hypothetical protein [Caulobacteraceae bacterium]